MASKEKEFQNEKQVFSEHIQKAGLRNTAQRELILDIFLRTEEHLSSEDLYWLVHKEDSSVGHTTVYRTLKLLTDAGLAREVRFGDGKSYYEHHYNHEHHDHMICTECGKVVEFFSPEIESLQETVAAEYGFRLTHHSMRILGLCGICQKKDSESAASGAQPRVRVKSVFS
ncbi:MAG: transcriptional repressor [Acidobacteria bacterium]|jgi:Fur family ferric uptake transcriptional regulator|nr:transcriptional repressor [Acidobacteriota bacterium]MBA3785223.1 transcriptional repressor [Acidobacteriota bacterium]MBA4122387.1 transcriptional repressor [Acidobacteriota bacterium]HEV8159973.1 Fur family transcriptional regulator [Pyrinomonadaceae bacterium]